ncbi:ABC transporter permease [Streptomyces sp. NPDC015130]|uniref:ABC transporter permease n=1 Tax=Streptomyces sp. NPDC015130 TaxID=3364940 RepID=UPI003700C964
MSTLTLKGPYWVTVRQYRRTLWLMGAAVVVALAVIGGLRVWDAQYPDTSFADGSWTTSDDNAAYSKLRAALAELGTGMAFLPLLVGAFVAGPLIAREFESGTYKLSLTQSVSPAVWLRAKLLTAAAVATLGTLALMGVFRLGHGRVASSWNFHWADPGTYEATGIVLLAYVLAAVAVGALVGQLIRRTLVAMAATGLLMGLVVLCLGAFRWSFLPVATVTGPHGPTLWTPDDGLMTESGLLTASGVRFDQSICWNEVNRTPDLDTMADGGTQLFDRCLARNGVTHQYVDYHPQSHFWPTQLIETGIVLALGALALYAAFRVLRARHAG